MSMVPIAILLGGFIFLMTLNVPVAFSMILACIGALWWHGTIPVSTVTMKLYSGIDTFPFLAIPLFILAGGLMEQGGISQRLVRLASNLVGHIRGGLGFVVVVSEILFYGISGSSIADASAIGSLLLMVIIYIQCKEITRKDLYKILVDTAVMTGVVSLLVSAATGFSWILATHQVPRTIGNFIVSVGGGHVTFLLLSIVVFFVFGMMLDGLPAILIFFPILFPIATSVGVQPLHFGVLVIAVVGISIVAPPIGLCLVILCSLAKIKLTDTILPLSPSIAILVVDLVIIAFWPGLVMILPTLFKL